MPLTWKGHPFYRENKTLFKQLIVYSKIDFFAIHMNSKIDIFSPYS